MNFFRVFFLSTMALSLTGVSSCSESLETVCIQRLPGFELALVTAFSDLQPDTRNDVIHEYWPSWAEGHLKDMQYWMDLVDDQEIFREEQRQLSAIANDLVIFHGYASRGDSDRMRSSIEKMRKAVVEARSQLCGREED
ncbi:MAG TPA: hypothetical protein DCS07_12695 [Bdellovibrionales bacterium]|nr:MAG: hypothetical protein A2Z97_07485 [Bdellovibrionales bacterium GWB1_52_6]OFZ04726.1 MAG: hypothetical protein A2X97_13435 [Bdellovibrionales bacterium GWA1_52_35]OFZ44087.1 MAG: hypothetical protein A2070_01450 [Bdellovibrionales bacterium GWC1_52_8]HAR43469.1 hypothetical protein [Bdellovibrionales bacterium]HCM39536.1 hypothetical protein [Bdellovibrionales bacterium]